MKVKELKDQINTPRPRPFLYCRLCGAEYSANSGDYFMSAPDDVLECCEEPMELVEKVVTYRKVKV